MGTKAFDKLPAPKAMQRIGDLIDASSAPSQRGGLRKALTWADKLEARGLSAEDAVLLDYFRANAWDKLRPRANQDGELQVWEDEASEHAVFYLRRARNNQAFSNLPPARRCEILTNLGSELSRIGRVVEAFELWEAALAIEPRFWMARGNFGKGLTKYGRYLYIENQTAILLFNAHAWLTHAIKDASAHPEFGFAEATENFDHERRWIEARVHIDAVGAVLAKPEAPLGRSKEERTYREWCFRNRLFLDPFNDAKVTAIASADMLTLPSFVTKLGTPPNLIGFYNQIKQEFASARYEYFLATQSLSVHFSDRYVSLPNTLDYPSYGLAVERMRTSYRVVYSLFDKIAFFLNDYFKIGMPLNAINFRTLWKEQKGKTSVLRRKFARSRNAPLHALYWLSKDLFDGKISIVLDPDARSLHDIRIRLEHRYFKVHEIWPQPKVKSRRKDLFEDRLAYSIGRSDFEQKTLRLFKTSRAAIIYLALAMQREEKQREARRRSTKPMLGQSLPIFEDNRKR